MCGRSISDVRVVKVTGTKAYQYTACDDCARLETLPTGWGTDS